MNGVTIGTPEDLSLSGKLSSFFARKGIVFDLETGLFRVDNEYTSQIRLVGHGQKYAMVRKALQRNGILANRTVESDTYIETGDLKDGNGFILHPQEGEAVTLNSIEELLERLQAGSAERAVKPLRGIPRTLIVQNLAQQLRNDCTMMAVACS